MRIAVVTSNYPWRSRPYCGTFVRELVWEFARQGHDCSVISPISIWNILRFGPVEDRSVIERVPRSETAVRVIRPRIVTASARRFGPWNSADLSNNIFSLSVTTALDKMAGSFDCVYAHFFYPAGLAAVRYAKRKKIPFFIAHGDDSIDPWYLTKGKMNFKDVTGVVAVSTGNARFCRTVFDIPESRIKMFPNGVDRTLFFPRGRAEARRRLGLSAEIPLVAFVGHFIPRKGPDRVLAAIEKIPSVKALMIGEGPMTLRSERIQFQGVVEHSELPWYLSAADVFVLPTTGEGSCNAVLEAMACGLPVVTSEASFNDDILTENVAVRVDPMNIMEIRHATAELLDNPDRRKNMSKQCLDWCEHFGIEKRAMGIAAWMTDLIQTATTGEKT